MSQKYTEEELLEQLRRCAAEHSTCSPERFDKMENTASSSLIGRRFDSWTAAKEKAGIDEDLQSQTGRSKQYSDEDVLRHLRECADRNNGKCTVALLREEDDLVSSSVAIDRFGSWAEAKQAAGLKNDRKSNFRPREYDDADYLEFIRECQRKHGKATQRQFDDDDEFPSAAAVRKRFGSWSKAKEQAGIAQQTLSYTDDELLEALRTCERRHDSVTARTFAADDDFPSPETLQRRFGSWTEAKKRAGVGRYADE